MLNGKCQSIGWDCYIINELDYVAKYRYGGVKVIRSKLSIGFAVRVVYTWAVYDNKNWLTNIDYAVGNKLDFISFHNVIKILYNCTFN